MSAARVLLIDGRQITKTSAAVMHLAMVVLEADIRYRMSGANPATTADLEKCMADLKVAAYEFGIAA